MFEASYLQNYTHFERYPKSNIGGNRMAIPRDDKRCIPWEL